MMSHATQNNGTYHFFISHGKEEVTVARDLKSRLEDRNYTTYIYEDDMAPGSFIHTEVCNVIERSKRCMLLISENFLSSWFFHFEFYQATVKEQSSRIVSLIPILIEMEIEDLPEKYKQLRDRNCLKYDPENVDDIVEKLIISVKNDVSIEQQVTVQQTGVGLAWSYYYGYLKIVLPSLINRINKSEYKGKLYPKMIIILPLSCKSPPVLPNKDGFEFVGYVPCTLSRSGNKERDYKNSIYNFTFKNPDAEDEVRVQLVMEFATPLFSLYEMFDGNIAGMTKEQMTGERHTFKETLQQILNKDGTKECHDKYILVDYRDEDEQTTSHMWSKEQLSDVVARAVISDMTTGKCSEQYQIKVSSLKKENILGGVLLVSMPPVLMLCLWSFVKFVVKP